MTKGQTVGYVRVSTIEQNTDRQLDGLQLDRVFTDKASGKDTNRPELQACLKYLRDGDTLVVHEMSRLARSLRDLLSTVEELIGRGVSVRFVKENLTFTGDATDPYAVFQLHVLGAVAELERSILLERQREGIAIAKTKGVYKGRVPSLDDEVAEAVAQRLIDGDSASMLAREFNVSRATVYNVKDRIAPEPWTLEDVIAVDDLFREHGKLTAQDDEVQELAEALGRTPTAVSARMRNLQAAHEVPGVYPGTSWHFTKMDRQVADRVLT